MIDLPMTAATTIDTLSNLIRDTVVLIDTVLIRDTLFTSLPADSWEHGIGIATVIVAIASIGIAAVVAYNQYKKTKFDKISAQPNLVIRTKIFPGANDDDPRHLRIWNNGLGPTRIKFVKYVWQKKPISEFKTLANLLRVEVEEHTAERRRAIISFGLHEFKEGQIVKPNEEITLVEALQYEKYIENFTEFDMAIHKGLEVEIEYESLWGKAGKPILFPRESTVYICDTRSQI